MQSCSLFYLSLSQQIYKFNALLKICPTDKNASTQMQVCSQAID